MKRIIWLLLIILGLVITVVGCARWPEPEPEPGEPEYQLKMTVEVTGETNSYDGIYYIVFDTDGDSGDGPGRDIFFWEDNYYYIKLENGFFYFAQKKDETTTSFGGGSSSGNKLQVTIALSDLGDPEVSIDINVLTTDSGNETYDYLDPYFTIGTGFGSTVTRDDSPDDSGDGGADFDILKVTTNITTF